MALPEDRRLDPRKFPEKARKLVDPRAPDPMKMMAARGMVPLKPLVQVCVLHNLAHEGRASLASQAAETLRGMPRRSVLQIAKERLMPVVLHWLYETLRDDPQVMQALILNQMTDVDTLAQAAEHANEAQCEMLAANQAKLLTSPPLVKALYFNRALRASTADKMIDLCVRNEVDLSILPGHEEIIAAAQGIEPASAAEAAKQDAAFKAVQSELGDVSETQAEALADAFHAAVEGEQPAEEELGGSAAGRIRSMNIAQRVRLANLGTAAEREILIRDTNKVVARAVIRSPAISDQEIFKYSKDKRIIDEVIQYIAKQKRWIRHYRVKVALVNNPKCPLSEVMRFLPHLRTNDLRAVVRSKGVPAPVSKAAKQLVRARLK